ncbi:MAG: nucleotidyltransferase family protein [Patescibacteria group bacterium]
MMAIVLAGGRGERLRPLTELTPKPMIEILKKPILYHHIAWLASNGVKDVIVACGYKESVIITSLTQNPPPGVGVSFITGCEPLGRGGAIKKAAKLIPTQKEPVVVSYSDILSDIPVREVLRLHHERDPILTVVVVPYRSPFGIVEVTHNDYVTGFQERPRLPYWVNSGIFVASREFLRCLPDQGEEEETIKKFAKERRVTAFRAANYFWRSVDTLKDLQEVEQNSTPTF